MNLKDYDVILVNSSAGKDSQAMLDYVHELALAQGVEKRIVVVHADLGRVEWKGKVELAAKQAAHYGHRFIKVKRTQNDLLDHVRSRGMWPSSKQRYCTSDHKRGPIRTVMTRLTGEFCRYGPVRILNCMGMRAQESPARAKKLPFVLDEGASNGKRLVYNWLPIHAWTVDQVWERIRASGVPHHYAYDLGMPRLSCIFCIFAPVPALILAGKHNPELLQEYVDTEVSMDHTFRQDVSLVQIQKAIQAGEGGPVTDWRM